MSSFFAPKPSYESIAAIENCTVYCIYYDQLQYLYNQYADLNTIGRRFTEYYYITLEERSVYLQFDTAEKKYTDFMNKYADLSQKVTLKSIASFLGITLSTLSRIRKNK